ncbi:MAG: DNA-binding domain-containing protein [Methylococcales bacterium]
MLAELQKQFMQVLQGANPTEFSETVVTQGSVSTLTRIDIYRNAYHLRLKESIEIDHEMLGYYLGDELFDQMVSTYIAAYPSQQTSLRYFSEQLPVFLTNTTPFNEHPVLAELARFERYLLFAFDARDATTASAAMLSQIPAQDWPQLHFRLHPSVQRYKSDWNAVGIWQALKQEEAPPVANQLQQCWLIWRNVERLTEFRSLNVCEQTLLEGMIQGLDYADLCEHLTNQMPVEQVSEVSVQCLVNWLNLGIISKLSVDPEVLTLQT